MNTWGNKLHEATVTIAEMAAVGMGLDKEAFTQRMKGGAHLLATVLRAHVPSLSPLRT